MYLNKLCVLEPKQFELQPRDAVAGGMWENPVAPESTSSALFYHGYFVGHWSYS